MCILDPFYPGKLGGYGWIGCFASGWANVGVLFRYSPPTTMSLVVPEAHQQFQVIRLVRPPEVGLTRAIVSTFSVC